MTGESSRRTSCALPSKIPGAEPMAAGRNGGRAKSQPSRAAKVSTRHSTAGRMRAEGCTGTSGCPVAFPDAAARTRASVRRSRTPETHPTRCHTGRNEAVLTSEDSSLERRLPGRQSPASSGWRRLPRPPQLTLSTCPTQPLAVSETHAPPGLDGPIFERFSGGASPPGYDRT